MPQVTETDVFRACRTLFGPEFQLSRDFLSYLQPAGVRSAYRKKAKTTHPDRFASAPGSTQSKQMRLFQDLTQAHETLLSYLRQRHRFSTVARHRYSRQPVRKPTHGQQRDRQHNPRQRPLPTRPLQFGMFLYYQGIIPFDAVISAIIWQRRQRPNLGKIAKGWGWLDDGQIETILRPSGGAFRFGERAEKLGYLTPLQVRTLLCHQRSRQQQMGHYFVQQGYLDEASLDQLLHQLAEHNRTHRKGFSDYYYFYHR